MSDSEIDLHYDTDAISLTSTRESENGDVYDIVRIMSERDGHAEHAKEYLIEWEGYRMDECTWEPTDGLLASGLLELWERNKRRMGEREFKRFCAENEAAYRRAYRRHHEGKPIRKAKREKMRRKAARSTARGADTSSLQQKQSGQPKMKKSTEETRSKPKKPADDVTASPTYNDLFVGSQDTSPLGPPPRTENNERFYKEPTVARKAPLEQSSSEGGDTTASEENSDDSLMCELSKKDKKRNGEARLAKGHTLGDSMLSHRSPSKNTDLFSAKSPPKRSATGAQHRDEPSKPLRRTTAPAMSATSSAGTDPKKKTTQPSVPPAQVTSAASRGKSTSNTTVTKVSTSKPPNILSKSGKSTDLAVTPAPPKTNASTATTKTGTNFKSSAPIKMINAPKPPPREWKNGDSPFNTLKYRHQADKRSRTEGTPDLSAVSWVGRAPTGTLLPKPSTREDNPYGRREAGARRPQDDKVDEPPQHKPPQPDVHHEGLALKSFEVDKAPLVCYDWRMSSSCQYTDEKCRFLHRHKDEHGRDIPIAKETDFVPPKYRKPPLTCPFWLYTPQGCRKQDDACIYAHRNTGWAPKDKDHLQEAFQIDPTLLPASQSATRGTSHAGTFNSSDKKRLRSSQLTCWYWTKGKCRHAAEGCTFQHYYTGIVADPPPRYAGVTCKFYLEGHCSKSAYQCEFEHPDATDKTGHPSPALGLCQPSRKDSSRTDTTTDSHAAKKPRSLQERKEVLDEFQDHNAAVGADPGRIQREHSPSPRQPQPPSEQHRISLPASTSVSSPKQQLHAPTPPPPPPLTNLTPASASCEEVKLILEQALKVNFTQLFELGEDSMLDRRAMLFYHPVDHYEELELITRYLLLHNVEVSSAWNEGCWEYFRKQITRGGTGVVIVSQSIGP